jgi:hypothetical protein
VEKPAAPAADDPKKAAVAYGDTRRPGRGDTFTPIPLSSVHISSSMNATCIDRRAGGPGDADKRNAEVVAIKTGGADSSPVQQQIGPADVLLESVHVADGKDTGGTGLVVPANEARANEEQRMRSSRPLQPAHDIQAFMRVSRISDPMYNC